MGGVVDNMTRDREYFHRLLDEAMDQTREGESFVGRFVNKVIQGVLDEAVVARFLKTKEDAMRNRSGFL